MSGLPVLPDPSPSPDLPASAGPVDVPYADITVRMLDDLPVCDPELLVVTVPTQLRFTLVDSPAWAFPASRAVALTQPATSPSFPRAAQTVSATQVLWLDRDVSAEVCTYTVTVQHVGDGRLVSVDPVIKNQGN